MGKRKNFAIDAVVLSQGEVRDLAIDLSGKLRETSPFVLDGESYLPHISLAMGYVEDLNATKKVVGEASRVCLPIQITFDSLFRHPVDVSGYFFYQLNVRKNASLLKLHEHLISHLPLVKVVDFSPDYFYRESNRGDIVSFAFNYVGAFKDRYSREKYQPHLTLGAGPEGLLRTNKLPLSFTVDTISLCQVGNYCTCRKILYTP